MNYSENDFIKYKQYLNTLSKVLDKYFEEQKEYICCKKGCAYCCEEGVYPYSDLEFKYLLLGFFKIEPKEQRNVIRRIQELKKIYSELSDKKEYMHRCPFLSEENECTVYDYRGLICRTFGLVTQYENGKVKVPFCSSKGLNYSKVYNTETQKFDLAVIKDLGYKNLPIPHKTNIDTLKSAEMFEDEPLDFGEVKPLVEWL